MAIDTEDSIAGSLRSIFEHTNPVKIVSGTVFNLRPPYKQMVNQTPVLVANKKPSKHEVVEQANSFAERLLFVRQFFETEHQLATTTARSLVMSDHFQSKQNLSQIALQEAGRLDATKPTKAQQFPQKKSPAWH